jgi:hypothetical protein
MAHSDICPDFVAHNQLQVGTDIRRNYWHRVPSMAKHGISFDKPSPIPACLAQGQESANMTARLIIGITAWVCGVACALSSAFYSWTALDKVNDRLPVKERFWPLFWGSDSRWKLRHEYRRLYPGGELLRKARYFTIAFFACLLIAFWALHPFLSRFGL